MTQTLPKIVADFQTTLVSKVAIGDTTATLTTATDDDGVTLPTGTYVLTIDRKNSNKEYIQCTLTGTALTNIKTVTRGTSAVTNGFAFEHRKGAEVIISDYAVIKRILNVLDGTTDLDSATPLSYDGAPSLTPASNELATVAYVDAVSIAGAADATTTTKGISKMSVAPASASNPIAVGDNDGRVPTQAENDALVGNNTDIAVGSGNKMVTQTGLQHNAEKYAADAGANDTYVITLSPVPTSYTNGMVVYFKANTANTGAATINVNSLGAKTIVKGVNTTLADGDIAAGMFCTIIYDGTNFVLQNPVTTAITPTFSALFKNGTTTKTGNEASVTQNIAHGLGVVPKKVKLTLDCQTSSSSSPHGRATVVYNGTTSSCIGHQFTNGAIRDMNSAGSIKLYGVNETQYQTGVVTFDATNIIITWTKTGDSYNFDILWEAEA